MRWFDDRGIRTKLLGSFAILCALLALVGYMGVRTGQGIMVDQDEITHDHIPSMVAMYDARVALLTVQSGVQAAALTDDPAERNALVQDARGHLAKLDGALDAFRA